MEEKKKTTKTNKSKANTTKKTTTKKPQTKKVTTKKTATKPAAKKTTTKKVAQKKVQPKKVEKKIEEVKPIEKVEPKEDLEKTIIFDGKQNKNLKEVVEKLEEENVVVEDKVIKRSKARKVLIIITAILMVLIASASLAYVISQKKTDTKNNQTVGSNLTEKAKEKKIKPVEDTETEIEKTQEGYEHIVTINLAQFETKALNKDDMIVLVASNTCGACAAFETKIEKVFTELDKKIYRVDIKNLSEEEINTFRTYYAFSVTPTIFIVKDGKVVADTARTGNAMSEEELKDWIEKNN